MPQWLPLSPVLGFCAHIDTTAWAQYTLSMPSNNSWNGKWSGEDTLYAVVKSSRSKRFYEPILEKESWHYNFGDGWAAGIHAKEIDAVTARKVRKQSRGFCGYEWMIRSIEMYNEIRSDAA